MLEEQTNPSATGLSRLEELLEEFLAYTAEGRERFLFTRHEVSLEVRELTEELLGAAEAAPAGELDGLLAIPEQARRKLASAEAFYRLWGPGELPVPALLGNEPIFPERRRRVLALLRSGLDCQSREEGAEVLDRLVEACEGIPGLGYDFTCWLYLLAPTIFPPLPADLFPGATEVLSGVSGPKETVRRLWAFGDKHALLLETDDLVVPTAFFAWLSARGAAAWSRPQASGPYYGLEQLIHETMLAPAFVERLVREIQSSRMLLFTGGSGTGKTHTALRFARYLVRDQGAYQVVRAHRGLGYAELVGRHSTPGVVLQLAAAARHAPGRSHVLLIDGIDRLDLESALGDLLFSCEYPEEPLTTVGGLQFTLPPNLLLLATSRRSWEELLLDCYEVYRLFSHARFSPDPLKLAEFFNRRGMVFKSVDVVHCFRKLNRLLQERNPTLPQVGHGYLMVEGLTDGNVATYWDTYIVSCLRSLIADPKFDLEPFRLARLA